MDDSLAGVSNLVVSVRLCSGGGGEGGVAVGGGRARESGVKW